MQRIYIKNSVEKNGEKVNVQGWASTIRDHGGLIFIDLRDWSGVVQVVVAPENKEAFKIAESIGAEYVLSIDGKVVKREEELVNDKIETGKIEIRATEIKVLNKSKPLPFPIDTDGREINEQLRLKYRYLDLRRERLQNLMKKRHELMLFSRNWFSENEFIEIQTPLLTVDTPEGARNFYVPSRLQKGKFFVLPQSPQQYKQLLMVGGVHRYFQIAPCFRDEDPRADRHSGAFYQLDVECSFVSRDEFLDLMEPFFKDATKELTNKKLLDDPFRKIPYKESMELYGNDKPDLRFGIKLTDLTEEFNESEMKIFQNVELVKGVIADKEFSRGEIDDLTEQVQNQGAKGLAWFKIEDGELKSNIAKYFSDSIQDAILKKFEENGYDIKSEGQTLFAIAGERDQTLKHAAWLRLKLGDILDLKDPDTLAFAWIVDFPMYEWDEKREKWDFGHNPFSMVQGGTESLKNQKPEEVLTEQYDLVCNGYELSSGSIRNYNPEVLIEAFKVVGYSEAETREQFGHMISAFEYGAPPHGGFAPGLDRMMMVFYDESNIREIYAFPKTNQQELMTDCPREVPQKDLDMLGIDVKEEVQYKTEEVVNEILKKLEQSDFDYKELEHEEVHTSEESAKIRGTKLSQGAKALILNDKNKERLVMVVIPADKKLDVDVVNERLDGDFEIANKELVEDITGVQVGGIPPFGKLFGMELYFDEAWKSKDKAAFNIGSRVKSVVMSAEGLISVAEPDDFLNLG